MAAIPNLGPRDPCRSLVETLPVRNNNVVTPSRVNKCEGTFLFEWHCWEARIFYFLKTLPTKKLDAKNQNILVTVVKNILVTVVNYMKGRMDGMMSQAAPEVYLKY